MRVSRWTTLLGENSIIMLIVFRGVFYGNYLIFRVFVVMTISGQINTLIRTADLESNYNCNLAENYTNRLDGVLFCLAADMLKIYSKRPESVWTTESWLVLKQNAVYFLVFFKIRPFKLWDVYEFKIYYRYIRYFSTIN